MKKFPAFIIAAILLVACSRDNESQVELNPPTVTILSPSDDSTFDIGAALTFEGTVEDIEDAGSQLKVSISSDIQGDLAANIPITNSSFSYTTRELAEGTHLITISVIDSNGMQDSDEVAITISDVPNRVVLSPISLQNDVLVLNWTVSDEPEYEAYNILRSEKERGPYEVIETISDINSNIYTDENIEFGVTYFYKIGTKLLNSTEVPESNIEAGSFETNNIYLGTDIVRLKMDPVRPFIYALDSNNGKLLFINKETSQVEKTISVGSTPSDMDISLDNSRLYIALFNTNKIAVVDLETREKTGDLTIDTSRGTELETPYRLVCVGDNKLVITGYDQWNNIALVNATNGEILWIGFMFYKPTLVTPPDKMAVLVSETHSTGSTTYLYNLEANGLLSSTNVDNTGDLDWWHPQYGTEYTPISGDGKFIFYCGKKIAVDDLRTKIGSLDDKIHASNRDGSVAIGSEFIWDAEYFRISRALPFKNSGKMVFDHSSNNVYIYYELTQKLYYFEVE